MRKALAIDLDGTLIATNSFQDYLSYCGHSALYCLRLDIALSILFWVALRKVRLIRHSTMKRRLLNRTASFMQQKDRLDQFIERELISINAKALQLMEQYRNRGYLLILTTAAPGLYAHPIAENLHIDLCCATQLPSEVVIGQWRENVGEQKVDSLRRMLQIQKAELDVVITDHYDDLPLLNSNEGDNFVVAPSSKTVQMLKKNCTKPYQIL